MQDWIKRALEDLRKASVIQFVVTLMLVFSFVGYEITRGLSPITTTAILYWENGFTTEDLERSNLHTLCDRFDSWPMSAFIEKNSLIEKRCKILKRRHMTRTSADWLLYQKRVEGIKNGKANNISLEPKLPTLELLLTSPRDDKRLPDSNNLRPGMEVPRKEPEDTVGP